MIRQLLTATAFVTAILGTARASDAPAHADSKTAADNPHVDAAPDDAHRADPAPAAAAHAPTPVSAIDPQVALEILKEGNARFVTGESTFPHMDQDRRCDTTDNGQHPYVSILSCADSRVPPELAFDAGIGDLFVIRVAGNVADTDEIGTLEYGAGHLGTPLIVVMGHTKCGAVTAVAKGAQVHGSIPKLIDNIIPAVEETRAKHAGVTESKFIQLAIKQNVRQSMKDILSRSEEIRELVAQGKVMIVGAIYDIHNGTVEWIGEHPQQAALLGEAVHSAELVHDDADAAHADPHDPHDAAPASLKVDPHAPPAKNAHAAAPSKSSHGETKSTAKKAAADSSHAPTKKRSTSDHAADSHDADDAHDSKGAHGSKDAHGSKAKSSSKDAHGSDNAHAAESHGDADAVVDDRSLVQKHGILVPGVFLAAGSLLSGTVVFLLKSKAGSAAKHAAEKHEDEKPAEASKPAH